MTHTQRRIQYLLEQGYEFIGQIDHLPIFPFLLVICSQQFIICLFLYQSLFLNYPWIIWFSILFIDFIGFTIFIILKIKNKLPKLYQQICFYIVSNFKMTFNNDGKKEGSLNERNDSNSFVLFGREVFCVGFFFILLFVFLCAKI